MSLFTAKALWRENTQTQRLGAQVYGGLGEFKATAPARARLLGVDRDNAIREFRHDVERGHGEIRRSHEDNLHARR